MLIPNQCCFSNSLRLRFPLPPDSAQTEDCSYIAAFGKIAVSRTPSSVFTMLYGIPW